MKMGQLRVHGQREKEHWESSRDTHIDDAAAGLHVGHRLLGQADHAHDVHQERLNQALTPDLREVVHYIALRGQHLSQLWS